MNQASAISKINRHGILLVFPIHNRKEPDSLWRQFYPRKKMIWEWSDEGDSSVSDMWHLMKKLSDCRKVIYSKWYQGRATFFSQEVFQAMIRVYIERGVHNELLTGPTRSLFDALEVNSPQSTKELKRETELQGKFNEPVYSKSMRELFSKLLIVAYGEVADGAFPSLAVGTTRNLYEDIWVEAHNLPLQKAESILDSYLPKGSAFRKFFDRVAGKV